MDFCPRTAGLEGLEGLGLVSPNNRVGQWGGAVGRAGWGSNARATVGSCEDGLHSPYRVRLRAAPSPTAWLRAWVCTHLDLALCCFYRATSAPKAWPRTWPPSPSAGCTAGAARASRRDSPSCAVQTLSRSPSSKSVQSVQALLSARSFPMPYAAILLTATCTPAANVGLALDTRGISL